MPDDNPERVHQVDAHMHGMRYRVGIPYRVTNPETEAEHVTIPAQAVTVTTEIDIPATDVTLTARSWEVKRGGVRCGEIHANPGGDWLAIWHHARGASHSTGHATRDDAVAAVLARTNR